MSKEQKSKLDCISRQQAVEAVTNTIREKFSLADWYEQLVETGLEIENLIKELPPVTPTERTIDHDKDWIIGCIKHDGFINTTRGDKANQIILDAVQATERTGEWKIWNEPGNEFVYCTKCKHDYDQFDLYIGGSEYPNFCPNCGAKMGGDTE